MLAVLRQLIMADRLVRTLFVMLSITAVGEGIFSVLLIVFISRELNGGATAFGFLMSAQAVGGLLGSVAIGWIGKRTSPALLLGWCCLLFGIGDLAIINSPLIYPSLALVMVLFIAVGIPSIGFGTSLDTLFQSGVADEYRGRIFGALSTTQALLVLCGMLLGGTLGDPLGVIPVLNVQGGGYVVAGLIGLTFLPRILQHRQGSGERPVVTDVESFTTG